MKKWGHAGSVELGAPRGIPELRSKERKNISLSCGQCEKEFTIGHAIAHTNGVLTRKYCSLKCQHLSLKKPAPTFNCLECGSATEYKKTAYGAYSKNKKYCSFECRSKTYKGWCLDKNGYRILKVDGRHIPEHRLVLEKKLGRKLFPEETVHHINGVRNDNRPENLELWSSRHGKGQRVADKIAYAKEILNTYNISHNIVSLSDVMCGLMSMAA
jgi:hypothetical protein